MKMLLLAATALLQRTRLPMLGKALIADAILTAILRASTVVRSAGFFAMAACALAGVLGSTETLAQNAYIANELSDNVTVIDTRTNTVVGSPITVGDSPWGVAVAPDGGEVYVTNINSGTVSVIDARTNAVAATFGAGTQPIGVAVSPDGTRLYVANDNFPVSSTVTVIDAETGATVAAIPTAAQNTNSIATDGVAVSPDGKKVYALNTGSDVIRVIDASTNAVIGTIATPNTFNAIQAAFSSDGARAYVPQTRFPPRGAKLRTRFSRSSTWRRTQSSTPSFSAARRASRTQPTGS
jgi:YVTN family beta-propeller protein